MEKNNVSIYSCQQHCSISEIRTAHSNEGHSYISKYVINDHFEAITHANNDRPRLDQVPLPRPDLGFFLHVDQNCCGGCQPLCAGNLSDFFLCSWDSLYYSDHPREIPVRKALDRRLCLSGFFQCGFSLPAHIVERKIYYLGDGINS